MQVIVNSVLVGFVLFATLNASPSFTYEDAFLLFQPHEAYIGGNSSEIYFREPRPLMKRQQCPQGYGQCTSKRCRPQYDAASTDVPHR